MNVMVVGGRGFIGSRLLKRHADWSCLDIKDGGDGKDIRHVTLDYDVVVFLAASLEQDLNAYCYNLTLYEGLVRGAGDNQPWVIFTSSAAVEGNTLYGKSKRVGEVILGQLFEKLTVLRLSNVYGDGDGHGAIDTFINGNRIIYGDGSQVRDYIHVEKVCDAIDNVIKLGRQGTYNVSTGKGRTTLEVFKEFGQGDPDFQPPRDFDVKFSVLNPRAAQDAGIL